MDFLQSILPTIQHFSTLGYWVVFLLAFLESLAFVGLLIPGSVAVIFAGFLASQGILDIGDLLWFAAAGAILGDSLSFYLGRRGTVIFKPTNKIFKLAHLKKGEAFFRKHGGKSVFLGRFIGWIRPIIPFIAGVFKLDKKTFIVWNILSGILWAVAHLAIGYFFGQAWQTVEIWSTRLGIFLTALLGATLILWWFKWFFTVKGKALFRLLASLGKSFKKAFLENPDIKRLLKKHPKAFHFLGQRLSRKSFWGLPFTLLSLAFLYILASFGGVIEDIIKLDSITKTDLHIQNLLLAFRHPQLIKLFLLVTLLGKWQIIAAWSLVGFSLLWLWHKREYIVGWALALLGSQISVFAAKLIIHRPRPSHMAYIEDSFSFPSGHATVAVVFYGFIIYLCCRFFKKWNRKINSFFFGLAIILAIGLSRLYLGVHYMSDVWGGYLLGFLWLVAGISVSEWLAGAKIKLTARPVRKPKLVKAVSAVLLLGSLAFYGGFAMEYHPPIQQPSHPHITITQSPLNLFQNQGLPKYTGTLTGKKQKPISFIVVAQNDQILINAFRQTGWYLADKITKTSLLKIIKAAVLKRPYPRAPMTPSFWNNDVHDFGFEKPTQLNQVSQRHHARFWKTSFRTPKGQKIYVGTASLDQGLKWGITHKIEPDIDTEREYLFHDLEKSNSIASYKKIAFTKPHLGKNFSGNFFFTDGKAYLLVLK